jgi:DNA ligase-1
MKLERLVDAWHRLARTGGRKEKIAQLAEVLSAAELDEVQVAVAYLSGELPQGRPGLGPSALHKAQPDTAASAATLTLADVDRVFRGIAEASGPGSGGERIRLLGELLEQATEQEQDFLRHLIFGELRQGAQAGLMLEAVAEASGIPRQKVRRAAMLTGDAGLVAQSALEGSAEALARLGIELFRPVQPMLAKSAEDVGEALEHLGCAAFETKLDGARIQLHKSGDDVRIFTRRLNDVTQALPEIVEAARRWPVREIILDGEAIALRANGTPRPFQVTMSRFGSRLDVERLQAENPLSPFFFDCLYLDGRSLIDYPAEDRFVTLAEALPADMLPDRVVTGERDEASRFLDATMEAGHEGVMAKMLDAPYAAGARGRAWLKIKPAHTLDLVVLAAEWGHGRRRGWLSNLHLGARDPESGSFVMLGKTFKGMTDAMLAWQTERLQQIETHREGIAVFVRPELVVEIAFNDIQTSPKYPAGLALRFARVKAYREDKTALEADTIETVRAIHEAHLSTGET